MTDWLARLTHAAQYAGDQPIVWQGRLPLASGSQSSDARLLILPRAARIMGCELPGVEGNLFFHHQGLEDPQQAGSLLAGGGGIGGDRLWVAPESAFMWKNLAAVRHDLASHGRTPKAMDPGNYVLKNQSESHLTLASDVQLIDDRLGQPLSLRLQRQFELIDAPTGLPAELHCVSFAICNEVTLVKGGKQTHAGCWDLLQLPAGGMLICPTTRAAAMSDVRSYYEAIEEHVSVTDEAVLFRVDSNKRVKMGMAPELTTGRMGYYRRADIANDVSTLIVRLFLSCPGQRYIDLPVDEILEGKYTGGDALQAYNHNDAAMAFGEMEYHDPAVRAGIGPQSSSGRCVTHVLAGPDALIRKAGEQLLGVAISTM